MLRATPRGIARLSKPPGSARPLPFAPGWGRDDHPPGWVDTICHYGRRVAVLSRLPVRDTSTAPTRAQGLTYGFVAEVKDSEHFLERVAPIRYASP